MIFANPYYLLLCVIIIAGSFLFCVSVLNNRVIATRMKRMAFYKPQQCKVTPFKKTVPLKSLFCIAGATGIKAAVATRHWTNRILIKLN